MTKKYLQLLTLSLIIALSLTLAGMALAQTWQPPQNTTPPECTADDDGCYVPINVSSKDQIKKGFLTLVEGVLLGGNSLSNANLDFVGNGKWIRFAKSADDIEPGVNINDGKIGRLTGSDNLNNRKVLDIIGVRQDLTDTDRSPKVKNRLVRIWDNLTVSGTTTTSNLYAKNYYICNEAGSCTKFEGGGGDSLWENIAGTAKVVLKALPTAGRVMVGIGNNNPTVDLEVGSPTHTTSAYVGVRSATDKYAGYRWANGDKNIWWLYKPANNNTEGVPAESLVLGNTASGGTSATPKVVFTSGAGGANAYVMDVKGSAKATSLSADTIVALNPSPSSNPTNTGLVLANSPVNEDHVLYVQGSPAGGSTLRNVFLKPVSQIGGGVLSQFWNKVSGQEEITYTGRVGVAGANDPSSRVDLAIGSTNGSGLKADNGDISIVTNGSKNLTVSNSANSKFEVGIGTKSSTALSVPGTGIFSNGVSLGGNSAVSSSSDIKFYNADNTVFGRVYGTNSSLSLVGIGSSPNRLIRLYDTASTTNLIANNICTAVGSCASVSNIVNNTTGFWTKITGKSGIIYSGQIGIAGADNPFNDPLLGSLDLAIGKNSVGFKEDNGSLLMKAENGGTTFIINKDGNLLLAGAGGYTDPRIAGGPILRVGSLGFFHSGIKSLNDIVAPRFCLGDSCITSWPIPGSGSPWISLGNNIYNSNSGNIGIGNSSPQSKLHVSGEIRANNFIVNDLNTAGTGIVRAREVAVGGGGITLDGITRKSWSRITCSFNSAGTVTAGGCPNAVVDTSTVHRNYTLSCPSNYRVVSGGAWCDSPPEYLGMLRENRPDGGLAWKVSCVGVGATTANLLRDKPIGGATLTCEKIQ